MTKKVADESGGLFVHNLSEIPQEDVSWLWNGYIARRKITIITGDPGAGKSRMVMALAAAFSRGTSWPNGTSSLKGRSLILGAEDGVADTIVPFLKTHGADLNQIGVVTDAFDLPEGIEKLANTIAEHRTDLVIIDPINSYLGNVDGHRDIAVRTAFRPLVALLSTTDVALVLISHLSKKESKALYRMNGSIAFAAMARMAYCVGLDPAAPGRRVLACLKNNLAKTPDSLAFTLSEPHGKVTWEAEPNNLTADEILSADCQRSGNSPTAAETFVAQLIDNDLLPLEAAQVEDLAQAKSIPKSNLSRASQKLGIRKRRSGFGSNGKFTWLPPEQSAG